MLVVALTLVVFAAMLSASPIQPLGQAPADLRVQTLPSVRKYARPDPVCAGQKKRYSLWVGPFPDLPPFLTNTEIVDTPSGVLRWTLVPIEEYGPVHTDGLGNVIFPVGAYTTTDSVRKDLFILVHAGAPGGSIFRNCMYLRSDEFTSNPSCVDTEITDCGITPEATPTATETAFPIGTSTWTPIATSSQTPTDGAPTATPGPSSTAQMTSTPSATATATGGGPTATGTPLHPTEPAGARLLHLPLAYQP